MIIHSQDNKLRRKPRILGYISFLGQVNFLELLTSLPAHLVTYLLARQSITLTACLPVTCPILSRTSRTR